MKSREGNKSQKTIFKTKNVKALVVDDNEVNCMIASNVFKRFNIEVEEADSGTMAVSMCNNSKYDIILMDYLMPGMNGAEAIKNIRKTEKGNREGIIIALTANITKEIEDMFFDAGAQAVLEKPIEIEELSNQLKKWLPAHKIIHENESEEIVKETPDTKKIQEICWDALETALEEMTDFQWQEAISTMCQSVESYVKILKVSCKNVKEQIEGIRGTHKMMKVSEVQIYFHSLKGIFANIGAKSLEEEAHVFETAAKNEDERYIEEHKEAYLLKTELFIEQLKEALSLYDDILAVKDSAIEIKTMERKEFMEKLEILKEYIKRFEFNEITALLKELTLASQGENKENLQKTGEAVQLFQYEEALEHLSSVKLP